MKMTCPGTNGFDDKCFYIQVALRFTAATSPWAMWHKQKAVRGSRDHGDATVTVFFRLSIPHGDVALSICGSAGPIVQQIYSVVLRSYTLHSTAPRAPRPGPATR